MQVAQPCRTLSRLRTVVGKLDGGGGGQAGDGLDGHVGAHDAASSAVSSVKAAGAHAVHHQSAAACTSTPPLGRSCVCHSSAGLCRRPSHVHWLWAVGVLVIDHAACLRQAHCGAPCLGHPAFALVVGSWLYRMEFGLWLELASGEVAMDFVFFVPNLLMAEWVIHRVVSPCSLMRECVDTVTLCVATATVAVLTVLSRSLSFNGSRKS